MEILHEIDTDRMKELRERGEFFWLNFTEPPSDADLERLAELLTIHPLAIEDTQEFGQHAKLDDYPNSALLVVYGAEPQDGGDTGIVEVHLHLSREALVTVPRRPLTTLTDARDHVAADSSAHAGHAVHQVLDALADSFLAVLDGFDYTIDELQEELVEHAAPTHRRRIFRLRHQLGKMHRVVDSQRDVLGSADLTDVVPGLDHVQYGLRDVHDHLACATELIAAYREQLGGLLDLYMTEMSNRLNITMKRLTLIATVFLPLTFLSGFFGMNFGWFVQEIAPAWTFFAFGLGLPVISAVAVAAYLRRTDE